MSDLENPAPSRSAGARGWRAQPIAAIAFIVAVVVGLVIGVCASWLRPSTDDRLMAIGAAVIGGVLIGDGVHGLTRIAEPHRWAGGSVRLWSDSGCSAGPRPDG